MDTIVKLRLSKELHRRLRVWCLVDRGISMQEALVGLVSDAVRGVKPAVVDKGDMDEPLPKPTAYLIGRECSVCKKLVEDYTYTKDKKVICQVCARKAAGL